MNTSPSIHPTAIVSPKSTVASGVKIGPYAIVGDHVTIEEGTIVEPHAVIEGYTHLGKGNHIYPFAAVGTPPQDLKYSGERSFLVIGNNNIIRECVTINPGTEKDSYTTIGDHNLIMAYSHIAHNCKIGNHTILANCATLAGHITIEDYAVVGGGVAIHQFVNIGKMSMIGGCAKVIKDIMPFSLADGHPTKCYGLNTVGLQRREMPLESRQKLKSAFKLLCRSSLNISQALQKIEEELMDQCPEVEHLVKFIKASTRGVCK